MTGEVVTKSGMARPETLLARWHLSGGTLEQSQEPQVRSHRTEPWAPRLKGALSVLPGRRKNQLHLGGWRKHLAQVTPTDSQCADARKGWDATRGAQEVLTRAVYAAWTQDRPEGLSMKKVTVLSYLTKGLASNLKSSPKILSDTYNSEVWFLLTSLGTMISCLSVSFHQTKIPHLHPENRGALLDSCLKSLTCGEQPLLTLVTGVKARPKGLQCTVSRNNRSLQRSRYTMYFKPLHVQGYLSWSLAKKAV